MSTLKERLLDLFYIGKLKTIRNSSNGNIYQIVRYIESGAYGIVFKVSLNNKYYAAKIQLLQGLRDVYNNEMRVYTTIQSPYILTLYDHFIDTIGNDEVTVLILELMDGTLRDIMFELTVDDVIDLLIDILSALSSFHSSGISYIDYYQNNIFFKNSNQGLLFKLGDFGVSRLDNDKMDMQNDDIRFARLIKSIITSNKINDRHIELAVNNILDTNWDAQIALNYILSIYT